MKGFAFLRGIFGFGAVAQPGERLVRNEKVTGSNPVGSTIYFGQMSKVESQKSQKNCVAFSRSLREDSLKCSATERSIGEQ